MLYDLDQDVRQEASTSLVQIREKEKLPALIRAIQSEDPLLRYEGVRTLGRIGKDVNIDAFPAKDQLSKTLGDPIEKIRTCSAWALGELDIEDEHILRVLVSGLRSRDNNVVETALKGLSRYSIYNTTFFQKTKPKDIEACLLHVLQNEDAYFRASSIAILSKCKNNSHVVITALSKALGDNEKNVRIASAFAFSEIPCMPSVPDQVFMILCDHMNTTKESTARFKVCWALERLNKFPMCVLATLTKQLASDDQMFQFEVACLLSTHPGRSATKIEDVLLQTLSPNRTDLHWSDQVKGIQSLGNIGLKTQAARDIVLAAIKHDREEVRAIARRVLLGNLQ